MVTRIHKPRRKSVTALTHEEVRRKNIPTTEYLSVMQKEEPDPIPVTYPRSAAGLEQKRQDPNRDLDPQLVWCGKDERGWSDLVIQTPPLYIQEKIHPKVLIDDLRRHTQTISHAESGGEGTDRPVRGFQRPARRQRQDRVLSARRQLGSVEIHRELMAAAQA